MTLTPNGSAKVGAPGLVNFITAVAFHFCPSLPAALTQPGASTLANLCKWALSLYWSSSGLKKVPVLMHPWTREGAKADRRMNDSVGHPI